MKTFQNVVKHHKECDLYYNQNAHNHLATVAALIAVREMVREGGSRLVLHPTESRDSFVQASEEDWSKVYCYVDTRRGTPMMTYSHYDEQHVYAVIPLNQTLVFSEQDNEILEQAEKQGEKIDLETLWTLLDASPESPLLQALLCDRIIRHYQNQNGLVQFLITRSLPSIHSIYLHLLDYLKTRRLRDFRPKEKEPKKTKAVTKGVVAVVNQGDNADPNYFDHGLDTNPDVLFQLNYWNDGTFQITTSRKPETRHVDLTEVFRGYMEEAEKELSKKIIPLSTIKWVLQDDTNPLIDIPFETFLHLHPTLYYGTRNNTQEMLNKVKVYTVDYEDLTKSQWEDLDAVGLNLYDILQLTTKQSAEKLFVYGFVFYGKHQRPNQAHKLFTVEKGVKLASQVRAKMVKMLNRQES